MDSTFEYVKGAKGMSWLLGTSIGQEYGDPTETYLDAIVLMAQNEDILLDPVYSGKVASEFLAHNTAGR